MKGHEYPGSDGTPPELAVLGPLARTAADLALALGVLANQRSLLPAPKKPLHDYRVLVLDEHPAAATDIEVSGPLNNLAENLETRGVGVVRHVSGMPDLAEAHADYWQMLLTIMFENMPSDTSIDNHRWAELKGNYIPKSQFRVSQFRVDLPNLIKYSRVTEIRKTQCHTKPRENLIAKA